jgi:peptide/nickel transport system permease protein
MLRYFLRRIFVIPPVIFLVHFLGYTYAYIVRPLRAARNPYLAELGDSPPLLPTYISYLENLGKSDASIGSNIIDACIASFGLLGIALFISVIIGVGMGLKAARTNPPGVARWLTSISTIGLAMPSFYLGSLFFAGWFLYLVWRGPGAESILPFQGFGWDEHLIMPTIVLIARPSVQIAQVTSSLLAEELGKQYIIAARSIGNSWRVIRQHHALRNILAPIMLTVASSIRLLVAELIVTEWLFNWPGLGSLLARSLIPSGVASPGAATETIQFLNPPLVAAVISIYATLFLFSDLIASFLVRIFDPRMRTQ